MPKLITCIVCEKKDEVEVDSDSYYSVRSDKWVLKGASKDHFCSKECKDFYNASEGKGKDPVRRRSITRHGLLSVRPIERFIKAFDAIVTGELILRG